MKRRLDVFLGRDPCWSHSPQPGEVEEVVGAPDQPSGDRLIPPLGEPLHPGGSDALRGDSVGWCEKREEKEEGDEKGEAPERDGEGSGNGLIVTSLGVKAGPEAPSLLFPTTEERALQEGADQSREELREARQRCSPQEATESEADGQGADGRAPKGGHGLGKEPGEKDSTEG